MKKILLNAPEYYLVVLILLVAYSPPFYINPFFIPIILLIAAQVYFENRFTGMFLGTLFFLVNIYFLIALFSEFREFEIVNYDAQRLLFIGLSIFILNLAASTVMLYKYALSKKTTLTKIN